ncbi:CCA tRNA nucleotidyltransferase, partial [Candidatus Bathyarchaeota archaeon]|nr:CCA tRNA nucleotidyltransferase [Candidatus Bathyarchaeota archaeon]
DLFILVPKGQSREVFIKVLDCAKRVAGENYLEAYAEHPYIESNVEGFTVDFVPCFKVSSAEQAESSVDRTPFHTQYVKKHLTEETKREVRVLKRFMRGIGTYGAEIKVGGFSGYLCEVLILYYGSFINLLRSAADWKQNEVIDLENHFKGQTAEAKQIFHERLIVVDPVDKGRNVASAVKPEKLSEFIAASRQFLKNPRLEFFYPKPTKPLSFNTIARTMKSRGTTFVFLKTRAIQAVPDVLWGQLYRSQKALAKTLSGYSFSIVRHGVWSDEKSANIFLFEMSSHCLPAVERHTGPPVWKKGDCEKFLEKHLESKKTLSGPRIEDNHWIVDRQRKYINAVTLLREKLENDRKSLGIASMVSDAFTSSFEIWVNKEIKKFYIHNRDFAVFFTEFLKGKPRWLL